MNCIIAFSSVAYTFFLNYYYIGCEKIAIGIVRLKDIYSFKTIYLALVPPLLTIDISFMVIISIIEYFKIR